MVAVPLLSRIHVRLEHFVIENIHFSIAALMKFP